jgi:hypothetical protein
MGGQLETCRRHLVAQLVGRPTTARSGPNARRERGVILANGLVAAREQPVHIIHAAPPTSMCIEVRGRVRSSNPQRLPYRLHQREQGCVQLQTAECGLH